MQCLSPIHIRKDAPNGGSIVPCGKCEACVVNRASQWYVRLKQQLRASWNAVFVTLTYDEDHLPDARLDKYDFINIDVSVDDIKHYHYRLRKSLGAASKEMKYFLVSEYGPNPVNGWLNRPHYHAIYFNIDKKDYEKISKAWSAGFVEFGEEVTDGRIRYLAGYCTEKLFVPPGRSPTFACISKGIGRTYVDDMAAYHRGDISRMYVPNHGKKLPLPRYYRQKLYSPAQNKVFSDRCVQRAQAIYDNDLERFGGDHDRLQEHYSDVRREFLTRFREKHKQRKN